MNVDIPAPEIDDAYWQNTAPEEVPYIWFKQVGIALAVYKDNPHELCIMAGQDGWDYLDLNDVDAMYEALGKIRQWLHATKGE